MPPKFSPAKLMQYRRAKGLSQEQLAAKMGVVRQTILRWERGESVPSTTDISKLETTLELEADCLYDMASKGGEREYFVGEPKPTYLADHNTLVIPILARIPAGLPEFGFSERDVEGTLEIPRSLHPGAKYAVRAEGDSMAPLIEKGDICIIRPEKEPLNGKFMLVKTDEGFCIKMVVKKDDTTELHSLNPKYKPKTPKQLEILGQVIGSHKKFE
jgi:SOS-response transcriptional repressor LexA